MDVLTRSFTQTLRATRTHLGLPQRYLADRIGRSISFISQLESGRCGTDFRTIVALADVLGLDPFELLGATPRATRRPVRPVPRRRSA